MNWLGITHNQELFNAMESNTLIPLNDYYAWELYPKYNWVYSTSRLLEMQNIQWSPFSTDTKCWMIDEINFATSTTVNEVASDQMVPGKVFIAPIHGDFLTTDVAILKGEIKWAAHHVTNTDGSKTVLHDDLRGDIELRISAMATLHFQKFAGVISVDTIGHDIVSARLRMTQEVVDQYPEDWLKRVIRIYNRRPWGK